MTLCWKYPHALIQSLFCLCQASFLHIHGSAVCYVSSTAALSVHQTCVSLLLRSAKEQVVLSLALPLCLFPARCWIGSINKTTLKMKVQTLGDISSLTSCSLFGSLSTNHWAGPQEVTICGRHGDRVCGWALRLMCYLEQMKYDTGAGRERARRCREGNGRDGQRLGGVMSPGRQRAEPQRNRRRRAKL